MTEPAYRQHGLLYTGQEMQCVCDSNLVSGKFDAWVLLSVVKQAVSVGGTCLAPHVATKHGYFTVSHSTYFLALDDYSRGFNCCLGSVEESVTAATNAAEESKQRLLKTEGQAVATFASTSATAAASTTAPHQTATTAVSSGGKPPKAPRPTGGTQDSDACSSGQAGGAGPQKGNVGRGQDGRAGAAGRGPPDGDDDPYRPMGWRVSLDKSCTPAWYRLLQGVHKGRALGFIHRLGKNHEIGYGARRSAFPLSLGQQVKDLRELVDITAKVQP